MRIVVIGGALVLGLTSAASAQDAPDLQGTWSGSFKTVIFGQNSHHPDGQVAPGQPRVREIDFTLEVQGQDGRVLWGQSWSDPNRKEPFAATLMADGKTLLGADTDGSLTAMLTGPDRLDLCYTHTGLGPSKSIVASCGAVERGP
jgi:hypothetical protein